MSTSLESRAFIRFAEAEATGETSPLTRALRRVLEEPGEDFHRQVYADELDAVGEHERAEFIRFQCEKKHQGVGYNANWEYETVEKYAQEWFHRNTIAGKKRMRRYHDWYLADYGPPNLVIDYGRRSGIHHERRRFEGYIRRGFFSRIECDLNCWLDHGPTIVASHPVLEVVLTGFSPQQTGIGGSYYWRSFDGIFEADTGRSYLTYSVPTAIFVLLKDGQDGGGRNAFYPTCEAALAALSRALLAHAHGENGLKPLSP